MRRKKGQALYLVIAKVIETEKVFDLTKDNKDEFKSISEMVTSCILKECSNRDKLRLFSGLLPRVKRSFSKALDYLETQREIPVYKYAPKGKRNLEYVTTKKNYRKAGSRDTKRGVKQVETKIVKFVTHLELANPIALPQAKQKLLEGTYLN